MLELQLDITFCLCVSHSVTLFHILSLFFYILSLFFTFVSVCHILSLCFTFCLYISHSLYVYISFSIHAWFLIDIIVQSVIDFYEVQVVHCAECLLTIDVQH